MGLSVHTAHGNPTLRNLVPNMKRSIFAIRPRTSKDITVSTVSLLRSLQQCKAPRNLNNVCNGAKACKRAPHSLQTSWCHKSQSLRSQNPPARSTEFRVATLLHSTGVGVFAARCEALPQIIHVKRQGTRCKVEQLPCASLYSYQRRDVQEYQGSFLLHILNISPLYLDETKHRPYHTQSVQQK